MILAATGHRPEKLGGHDAHNPLRAWVRGEIRTALEELRPAKAISGMALGVDQDLAEICVELGIPFVAAIPFKGQELRWPTPSKDTYHALLAKAAEVVYVSAPPYAVYKMHARNHFLVENSDLLLAVFDGSSGGTAETVNYAVRVGRSIRRIDPRSFK